MTENEQKSFLSLIYIICWQCNYLSGWVVVGKRKEKKTIRKGTEIKRKCSKVRVNTSARCHQFSLLQPLISVRAVEERLQGEREWDWATVLSLLLGCVLRNCRHCSGYINVCVCCRYFLFSNFWSWIFVAGFTATLHTLNGRLEENKMMQRYVAHNAVTI